MRGRRAEPWTAFNPGMGGGASCHLRCGGWSRDVSSPMSPDRTDDTRGPSSTDLMKMHVHACYVHHTDNRVVRVNERNGGPAPRFWLGRTKTAVLWRFRDDVPADVANELTRLCRCESAASRFPSTPDHQAAYLELLADSSEVTAGPTYWLPRPPSIISTAVALSSNDSGSLAGTLDDWIPDLAYRQPFFASMSGSHAAAVCTSVRITRIADEAGVETALTHRRQGHACNAVAGWASAILGRGKVPLYSTSWDNRASQAVARRLGFEMFGEEYIIK